MLKKILTLASILLITGLFVASCSDDSSPTTGSTLIGPAAAPTGSSSPAFTSSGDSRSAGYALNESEEFNCTNVGEVRARFSQPGWVDGSAVGFYVFFHGFQDTNFTLRVWWNFEDDPENYVDVPLDPQDIRRNRENPDLADLEKVIEHVYDDVASAVQKRVRVELILADQTGNCARVRDVTLTPPARANGKSITRWSDGTNAWPDQACNSTNSFGSCDTNAQNHADAWATEVCQLNGYTSGVWTGNKMPGCSGSISMYCGGAIPCNPIYENTCAPGDQTQIEFTCTR